MPYFLAVKFGGPLGAVRDAGGAVSRPQVFGELRVDCGTEPADVEATTQLVRTAALACLAEVVAQPGFDLKSSLGDPMPLIEAATKKIGEQLAPHGLKAFIGQLTLRP